MLFYICEVLKHEPLWGMIYKTAGKVRGLAVAVKKELSRQKEKVSKLDEALIHFDSAWWLKWIWWGNLAVDICMGILKKTSLRVLKLWF